MKDLPWYINFLLGAFLSLFIVCLASTSNQHRPASLREKIEFYRYAEKHRELMPLMEEILADKIVTSAEVTIYVEECLKQEIKNANK
jgi:hypothetical protein